MSAADDPQRLGSGVPGPAAYSAPGATLREVGWMIESVGCHDRPQSNALLETVTVTAITARPRFVTTRTCQIRNSDGFRWPPSTLCSRPSHPIPVSQTPNSGHFCHQREETVDHCECLVGLPFESPHVAAASVLSVGTRQAALIGLQQMAMRVGATTWVTSINRRTPREQRDSLRRPPVTP